jgi:hypothetical protein
MAATAAASHGESSQDRRSAPVRRWGAVMARV